MNHFFFCLLVLCLPVCADEVRIQGPSPLQVRTRVVGSRMRVDVSPGGSLASKLPKGAVVSRPQSGTLRLEWPVPPHSAARCVRATDGRAVRVVSARMKALTKPRKTVSRDFVETALAVVIKILAQEMGRNLYIGPGVEGSVTVSLRSVPAEAALALILALQEDDLDYKVLSNGSGVQTVVVAPPEKLNYLPDVHWVPVGPSPIPPGEGIRHEILLDKAPAAKVMEFLQGQYKNVQFTAHPTMNGFYVYGLRKDVLQIEAEIPTLDRVPEPPPPPAKELLAVKYGDIHEIKAFLATLVPDLEYAVDSRQSIITVTGQPGAVEQVKELLVEFDRPVEQIVIDAKLADLTEERRKMLGLEAVRPSLQMLERKPFKIVPGMQFLVTSSQSNVLAAPRVATKSDKPAEFRIGDSLPLTSFDPISGEFTDPNLDVGLTVRILPSIKADGYIVLQLDVETSFVTDLVSHQYPCLATRKDTHHVRVKDGDTVVLSNLIPVEALTPGQVLPILRDLPITGTILRSVKSNAQIVLMLTPHVMR